MVEEFSDLEDPGEYLLVDRDPKVFPWMIETKGSCEHTYWRIHAWVHREDGDYKSYIPAMSLETLEKELKFLKLPSTAKLDSAVPNMESPLVSSMSPMAMLFHDKFCQKQRVVAFLYLLPVNASVHSEYKDRRMSGGERKMLVVAFYDFAKHISERGHRAFADKLLLGTKNTCKYLPWGEKLAPPSAETEFYVADFLEKAKLNL